MGKFSKRLNKINKNFRNILVVGSAFGNLEELLNDVATVFILYPKDESLRRKNLIYRETIESTFTIPEVDFVIIDIVCRCYIDILCQYMLYYPGQLNRSGSKTS